MVSQTRIVQVFEVVIRRNRWQGERREVTVLVSEKLSKRAVLEAYSRQDLREYLPVRDARQQDKPPSPRGTDDVAAGSDAWTARQGRQACNFLIGQLHYNCTQLSIVESFPLNLGSRTLESLDFEFALPST